MKHDVLYKKKKEESTEHIRKVSYISEAGGIYTRDKIRISIMNLRVENPLP